MRKIYLDNNATTALAPEVAAVMSQEFSNHPSNPSSVHSFGRDAKKKLSTAREKIASFFSVPSKELLFTSSATESLTHLLRGFSAHNPKCHILTSTIEHPAVSKNLEALEKQGIRVSYLPVEPQGMLAAKTIEDFLSTDSADLIVLSSANHETGLLLDLEGIANIAKKHRIPLFIDAVGHLGKHPFSLYPGISAAVFSGHKIHGPLGSGLTWISSSCKIAPLILGGGQEFGKRGGTENLPAILGLAKAFELLRGSLSTFCSQMEHLRNFFEQELQKRGVPFLVNGIGPRVSNVSNLFFPNLDGETHLMQLDLAGIAASQSSACTSGGMELSKILLSMQFPPERVRNSLRFSFSRYTQKEEILTTVSFISSI